MLLICPHSRNELLKSCKGMVLNVNLNRGQPDDSTQRGKKSFKNGRSRFPSLFAKCRNCNQTFFVRLKNRYQMTATFVSQKEIVDGSSPPLTSVLGTDWQINHQRQRELLQLSNVFRWQFKNTRSFYITTVKC